MFQDAHKSTEKKGFPVFVFHKTRFYKYLKCILIEFRCGFSRGPTITSQNLQKHLEYKDTKLFQLVKLLLGVMGLVLRYGLMSQWLKSKIQDDSFLLLNLIMVFIFLNAFNISTTTFYTLCFFMGFSVGYWVPFVTIAAEQFGTIIR
jgi:hypothetical protein